MDHEKVFAYCENLCLEETMTKEQIMDEFDERDTDISSLNRSVADLGTNKLDKSTISSGTSNPSGGSNGDIYFKYS